MPNRLINELSPYLLQHAHNPVDWYAWGDEAFEQARKENKPIFLSVGYATCHWCHVMERESFEETQAAEALNNSFVCIKVDREERPDIDAVYMAACNMITGSGGWPLTILMTPDKKPFFAGTYLPRESVIGRIGLVDLCAKITEMWHKEPQRVMDYADSVTGHLSGAFAFEAQDNGHPKQSVIDQAVRSITQGYDSQFGGFDSAPKFPMPHRLNLLMDHWQRNGNQKLLEMTTHTLTAMRLGGLWDHVGFGFHRYATDRQWLLPHFEKMLYDQALLATAYVNAFDATKDPFFKQTTEEILSYILRDMTDPAGGFYTAEDADSEGKEGKFYLWHQEEFSAHISGALPSLPWSRIFNMKPEGNFLEEATRKKTGTNILHLTRPWADWSNELDLSPTALARQWEQLRCHLFESRKKRIHPLKDDKILVDWNGMMIAALARSAQVLKVSCYLDAAVNAAGFILDRLMDSDGRLLHRFRQGESGIAATANDYAFFINGLLALFRADGHKQWLDRAVDLQQRLDEDFWDTQYGGYFLTAAGHQELPVRPKENYDGAIPSANAVGLHNLIDLNQLTGNEHWQHRARELIQAFGGSVHRQPAAYVHTLAGWQRYLDM